MLWFTDANGAKTEMRVHEAIAICESEFVRLMASTLVGLDAGSTANTGPVDLGGCELDLVLLRRALLLELLEHGRHRDREVRHLAHLAR